MDGVIRAIQASSKLRGYLKGREELDLAVLQAIIRAYYKEKSLRELYQELCKLHQSQNVNLSHNHSFNSGPDNLDNCDVRFWQRQAYELAKLFMCVVRFSSMLSGLKTRSLGLNTLGTT